MKGSSYLAALLAVLVIGGPCPGGDEAGADGSFSLDDLHVEASQLDMTLRRDEGREVRFRATVMEAGDGELVVLTAAHCLGPGDIGRSVAALTAGGEALMTRVEAVTPNPAYRMAPGLDSPGADNAVARLAVPADDDRSATLLEGLRPAKVTPWPVPDHKGDRATVLTVDQFGHRHVVRAGNYSNPLWLEWGSSYRPVPGDSGGGVFVVRVDDEGTPLPVLIGVVVVRSELGGGGSLLSADRPWLAEALRPRSRR